MVRNTVEGGWEAGDPGSWTDPHKTLWAVVELLRENGIEVILDDEKDDETGTAPLQKDEDEDYNPPADEAGE